MLPMLHVFIALARTPGAQPLSCFSRRGVRRCKLRGESEGGEGN